MLNHVNSCSRCSSIDVNMTNQHLRTRASEHMGISPFAG